MTQTLAEVTQEAQLILEQAIHDYQPNAVCGLFSGGNDSTTMLYATRSYLTHAVHINTGIGIEQTRQFVRDTCDLNDLPLVEQHAPSVVPPPKDEMLRVSYNAWISVFGAPSSLNADNENELLAWWQGLPAYAQFVVKYGFPGPGAHIYAYSWLKERALRFVRKQFIQKRGERVLFVTGVRLGESKRRMGTVEQIQREGAIVWVAPLLNWSNKHMGMYRNLHPGMPHNEVSDILHMSGECLCGSFAAEGEREFLMEWFPEDSAQILMLEAVTEIIEPIERERREKEHVKTVANWERTELAEYERKRAEYDRLFGGTNLFDETATRPKRPSKPRLIRYRPRWGLGNEQQRDKPGRTGMLCTSCDAKFEHTHEAV